jgi:hypothetical protein
LFSIWLTESVTDKPWNSRLIWGSFAAFITIYKNSLWNSEKSRQLRIDNSAERKSKGFTTRNTLLVLPRNINIAMIFSFSQSMTEQIIDNIAWRRPPQTNLSAVQLIHEGRSSVPLILMSHSCVASLWDSGSWRIEEGHA